MRRMLAAAALLCGTVVSNGQGQIAGSVRDAATSEPVRGAVVVLLGPNRELLVRTITSSSGTFRIIQEGAAIVRVMRIGYSPQERRLDGANSPLVIELTPLGRSLRVVSVNSSPLCPARADQQEALALWSSATDAFSSMLVASAEATTEGEVEQILYDRVVTTGGQRIVRQSTRRVTSNNINPVRAGRTPRLLLDSGYVEHRTEASTYYAPDPQVLLDSSFAETHCLSVHRDEGAHPGEVGVRFTPASNRNRIPDIAGVLWMKRSPMALTSLDFEYRGVDQLLEQVGAGGRLDFETLSNGMPIIREWMVRSPRLEYFESGPPRGPMSGMVGGRAARRAEIHEGGGLITDGVLSEGTRVTAPLAALGGQVLTRTSREPVTEASVTLDSTDETTVTDAEGRFSLTRLLPGPYTLRAIDSTLIATVRFDSERRMLTDTVRKQMVKWIGTTDVEARRDGSIPITVTIPRRARRPSCRFDGEMDPRYIVIGSLENAAKQRIPDTRLALTWADTTRQWRVDRFGQVQTYTTTMTSMEVVTDAEGGFVACGIPNSRVIAARAEMATGPAATGTARVSARPDDVSREMGNNDLRGLRLVVSPPDRR